jgi:UrcA family protein
MKHLHAVLVGALTLCPLSWDCLAVAPSNELRTETVRFADLDLTRAAGAQELYRRIRQAAREVCQADGSSVWYPSGYLECRSTAIARAVTDIGAPLLTEYHRALTHSANLQERQAQLK